MAETTTRTDGGSDRIVSLDGFKISKYDQRTWLVAPLTPWARAMVQAHDPEAQPPHHRTLARREDALAYVEAIAYEAAAFVPPGMAPRNIRQTRPAWAQLLGDGYTVADPVTNAPEVVRLSQQRDGLIRQRAEAIRRYDQAPDGSAMKRNAVRDMDRLGTAITAVERDLDAVT